MSGIVRIQTEAGDLRRVVATWQARHRRSSGAVHVADPSTLLVAADTPVEAIEDLLRALRHTRVEVEIIWRGEPDWPRA